MKKTKFKKLFLEYKIKNMVYLNYVIENTTPLLVNKYDKLNS
jgi:hypothetical protein